MLVEQSSRLRKSQADLLCSRYSTIDFCWSPTVDEGLHLAGQDDAFLVCFANEFFDALPIHIFRHEEGSWRELLVDAIDLGDDARFRLVQSAGPTAASQLYKLAQTPAPPNIAEISPETERSCGLIAQSLARRGGLFFCVDYGAPRSDQISLRVQPALYYAN